MAVEVIGVAGESNGYGDSMDAFRNAHRDNSRIILNLAAGRKKNDPPIEFNPNHADNKWPVMLYHPEKGEKVLGVSLVGLTGMIRKEAEQGNLAAVKEAAQSGYRAEPYQKPQIALLDPAVEKAALIAKNRELEGQLVATNDLVAKLSGRLDQLERKAS